MRNKVRDFLKRIIGWLQNQYNKLENQENEKLPYNSLSPINNADIGNDYKKSLDWALANRKKLDIKNIALTGPYGSGKSSILKTYITSYKGNDLHFLNISLATFKEEAEKSEINTKDELLRLIELSILQQIFYHEKDHKIPDSRFRKIKNYTPANLLFTTLTLFLIIISTFYLIDLKLFESILKIKINSRTSDILHYTSLLVVTGAILVFISKSIRTISNIKINKLNIQNAEIDFGENINKSILNHHIDEILYFFEVTKCNVVIIEDLDRFKQTEIFTKLREINLLVNNSKKIKEEVVFIYAVRDDIFKEENERTKFFDFIIPVIPIINPSNSSQKLLEKQALNGYKISENLVDSISLFIDDMRLLHNISNEFYLYQQKLNQSLNQDKLLSIIVYKNIFPNDFTLLSNNKGILYDSINNKQKYIVAEILRINNEINILKQEIKELENLKIKDIKELRYIYLLFYLPHLSGFVSFNTDGISRSLDAMASDINFEHLINNTAQYSFRQNNYEYKKPISIQFTQVEKTVDNKNSYLERKKQIEDWNNNKTETLKTEIQKLEQLKSDIRNFKVRELLKQGHIEIEIDNIKQKSLVSVLLRNGFIDEEYLDYVSIFYEGSITKNDHQFLINVKSQLQTDFSYKLNKIDKLIKKINPSEFDKEYTLNYTLLDFILKDAKYKVLQDNIFTKLKDESDTSVKFIDGFTETTTNIKNFISHLVKSWINIWIFLETKSNFTQEKKDRYFKAIVEHAEISNIVKLYSNSYFKNYLLQRKDFLSIIPNKERLKEIIESLNIKFIYLDPTEIPIDLLNFIYDRSFYEINEGMIRLILKGKDKLKENDFNTRNYFAIINSNCDSLIEYLQKNLNKYVVQLYFKLNTNNNEDEFCLINLLNSSIHIDNKIKIIKQVQTIINDINLIDDLEVAKILLETSKVSPTWENTFNYYERDENKISMSIITFLESKENASELSKSKIKKDANEDTKYNNFILKLINAEAISYETYKMILKSIPYHFSSLDFSSISEDKVLLLQANRILTFNVQNYKLLKETFTNLHIKFLELYKTDFIKNIVDYKLESQDLFLLLNSTKISTQEKNTILESIDESLYSSEYNSLKTIGELILKDNSFRISDSILKLIIVDTSLSIEQRIRILNWKHNQIPIEYMSAFLNSLLEPYSDITIYGKRPLLPNTEYNKKMVDILKSKNYISSYEIDDKGIRVSTFRK